MWRATLLPIVLLASSALAETPPAARLDAAPSAVAAAPATTVPADPASRCGYVSTNQGTVPTSQDIFDADITQIDGKSTPLAPENRYRTQPGTRVLTVADMIDARDLPAAAVAQIAKMKKLKEQRAYKKLAVEVKPGVSHVIGARLLRDKLDVDSIRDNAYWEPVVWEERAQPCK